jgi:hypothetical protein
MMTERNLSLGGKVALCHFGLLAATILLPLLPQPQASITNGDHWYWWFLEGWVWLLLLLTFPVSLFFAHAIHGGPFVFWMTPRLFVPLCFIFAANSFAVGYGYAFVHSLITKRWGRATASYEGS